MTVRRLDHVMDVHAHAAVWHSLFENNFTETKQLLMYVNQRRRNQLKIMVQLLVHIVRVLQTVLDQYSARHR